MKTHVPVLLHETISGLGLTRYDKQEQQVLLTYPQGIVIDGTLNNGGHTKAILDAHDHIHVIGFDLDASAIERAKESLEQYAHRVHIIHSSYEHMVQQVKDVQSRYHLEQVPIVGVLLDLGVSSEQLDLPGGGFSFSKDEPLDMRFDRTRGAITAQTVVNEWSQETLELIIRNFGEERYAGRIAREIVEHRVGQPILTTADLESIIWKAVPGMYRANHAKHGGIHPATRTFQAIRIAVNRELDVVSAGIRAGFELLSTHGRLGVISFHSLEDRIVKHFFQACEQDTTGIILTKKPITASEEELVTNPRSRSAKLRLLEKKFITQ